MFDKLKNLYAEKVPDFLKNKWGLAAAVGALLIVFWLIGKSLFLIKLVVWAVIGYTLFMAVKYVKESYDRHSKGK